MKTYILSASSLLAVSLAGSLEANVTDAQMRNLETRVSALEQKKGAGAMVNPSGRPQVRDGADLFFTADWLIWQAHENGLGYAVKARKDQSLSTALYNSSVKNMSFDWDSGFRVGLGWNTPHDGWDLLANWTWFQNKAKAQSHAGSGHMFLTPNTYAPATRGIEGFKDVDARWKLHLNMIDLELGREFFVSKWMTLRPFIGLRNAWIHQTNTVTFTKAIGGFDQTGTLMQGKDYYWGIGPRSGLNTQWGLGHGFSFFGNANLSLLYGFFEIRDLQNRLFASGHKETAVNNTDSVRVGRAVSELALGLRWDTMFAEDRCHFGIQAGWENLIFFGLNQFKQFSGNSHRNAGAYLANQGDLTIQGWTLSARVDF